MSNPTHIFVILRIPPVLKYICIIKVFFIFIKKIFLSFYSEKLIQFLVYVETASKMLLMFLYFTMKLNLFLSGPMKMVAYHLAL